jgi:hypothetical protein
MSAICVLLLCAGLAYSAEDETLNGKTIDQWIALLGSNNFDEREQASANLQGAGDKAIPALTKALGHADAEVRMRAQKALAVVNVSDADKLIDAVLDGNAAAMKKLTALGQKAEEPLNARLNAARDSKSREAFANLIARVCPGRVGYRVTLDLNPDSSGFLTLESDRTAILEGAQKFNRRRQTAAPLNWQNCTTTIFLVNLSKHFTPYGFHRSRRRKKMGGFGPAAKSVSKAR